MFKVYNIPFKLFLLFLPFFCQANPELLQPDPSEVGIDWAPHRLLTAQSSNQVESARRQDAIKHVYRAWDEFSQHVATSIDNFQQGKQQGVFLVHAMEDIMGAKTAFLVNSKRVSISTDDVSSFDSVFAKVSAQEYIDGYLPHVLAKRVGVSCSLVSYSDNHANLICPQTFTKCGFILRAPSQCIISASTTDAHTSVIYKYPGADTPSDYNFFTQKSRGLFPTPDAVLSYPMPLQYKEAYGLTDPCTPIYCGKMNEVFVASCARTPERNYSPEIAGVFVNEIENGFEIDYGNYTRSQNWVAPLINYANRHNLPVIHFPLPKLTDETDQEAPLTQKALEITDNKSGSYFSSMTQINLDNQLYQFSGLATYRFSDTQLASYGL